MRQAAGRRKDAVDPRPSSLSKAAVPPWDCRCQEGTVVMAIHTQESFTGFIASDPQLSHTGKGEARFYARVGQEHYRREPDGSFTELETTPVATTLFPELELLLLPELGVLLPEDRVT